jgi:hypothetical protein
MDSAVALGGRLAGPHLHVVPRDNPNRAHARAEHLFSVPVPAEVAAVSERYLLERAEVPVAAVCDFVFVNLFHAPLGEPVRYPIAHQLLAGLSAKAGLDRTVTPHMFRHGTGQALAGGGVDIAVIKEFAHHAGFTSTEICTRPSGDRLRQAVGGLPPLPRAKDREGGARRPGAGPIRAGRRRTRAAAAVSFAGRPAQACGLGLGSCQPCLDGESAAGCLRLPAAALAPAATTA